ncbi:MAG: hypothetical protein K2I46_03040 [Clostridia bacterium]|nr:hypothetical protein [Clostridia bacterium]MDE6472325.1 hypothetical protein [Clostridia bacterium]
MALNYSEKGEIIVKEQFHKKVCFDVANNRISAQFDGRGGISKYAVMNKYSVFSAFYTLLTINGKPLEYMSDKEVKMLGKKQITSFSEKGADIVITQFLDRVNNCVYVENKVTANEDLVFKNVTNFGIDFGSYVQQLLANRLNAGNISKIIGGLLKKNKKGVQELDGMTYIKGEVMGDFYLDIAVNGKAVGLESERGFYNQFSYGGEIKAGETKTFRYVISAGTRSDFTGCDVKTALKNFDKALAECDAYADELNCPKPLEGNFMQAYYKSLLNASLSNYKELGKFKGFLAGIVYQYPARTYYRDAYWTVLSVLPVKPELVRNEIITLANGISKKGECPSAVKFNFKNYWGDHYDSPSFFVLMLYDYLVHTKDFAILDEKVKAGKVIDSANLVLKRLMKETDETGLLVKGGEYNRRDWCDNVFRSTYVTYDEALYARALFAMSEIYKVCYGDEVKSKDYADKYDKVVKAINDLLWDEEKGWYVNYKSDKFVEDNLSIDTVVMVLFGLASEERADRMLKNMQELLESKNNKEQGAGDFGTLSVYPFYKNTEDIVQKSSLPYYYHNGGDWPYLSCVYAYAKLMRGMDYIYPLTRWFEYNAEKGNYTPIEFFSPIHPDGSMLQAWSSTGAFVLAYPEGDFFTKKLQK